tara:strand:- start:589 stop:846 length:258 start_codon:yes stop_codon:yes gene_type:complete
MESLTIEQQLNLLAEYLVESQPALSDILNEIADGNWNETTEYLPERHNVGKIPTGSTDVEFDTGTGEFSYFIPSKGWVLAHMLND